VSHAAEYRSGGRDVTSTRSVESGREAGRSRRRARHSGRTARSGTAGGSARRRSRARPIETHDRLHYNETASWCGEARCADHGVRARPPRRPRARRGAGRAEPDRIGRRCHWRGQLAPGPRTPRHALVGTASEKMLAVQVLEPSRTARGAQDHGVQRTPGLSWPVQLKMAMLSH
jgi:hypothetical protein